MTPEARLRLVMNPRGFPEVQVSPDGETWHTLPAVERVEVVADGRDAHGWPRIRVQFCPLALSMMDLRAEPERAALAVAGVDEAMIEAARAEVARRIAADP